MKREKGIRIILAILGIILVGTGVAMPLPHLGMIRLELSMTESEAL